MTTPSRDRHDMYNAILAIQTAVYALDTLSDQLTVGQRGFLEGAMERATVKLQEHIATDRAMALCLNELLAAAVAACASDDVGIEGRLERKINADEDELVAVLAGLLNGFGTRSPIVCAVSEQDDHAVLEVGRGERSPSVVLRFALAA